ncbi:MAG: hypothetical protein SNI70_09130 [Rikenellaceae bacterium]
MEDLFIADRLARSGANENCGLTLEEVRARSPDLTKLSSVRVDRNTVIFFDPTKTTAEKIKNKYSMYQKRIKNYDETKEIY